MGTISKALVKSNIKVNDLADGIDSVITNIVAATGLKPNSTKEDYSDLKQNHTSFPEEYHIQFEKQSCM